MTEQTKHTTDVPPAEPPAPTFTMRPSRGTSDPADTTATPTGWNALTPANQRFLSTVVDALAADLVQGHEITALMPDIDAVENLVRIRTPEVAARIASGMACARCGLEDGPMRPADDSNTVFVHSDGCPGPAGSPPATSPGGYPAPGVSIAAARVARAAAGDPGLALEHGLAPMSDRGAVWVADTLPELPRLDLAEAIGVSVIADGPLPGTDRGVHVAYPDGGVIVIDADPADPEATIATYRHMLGLALFERDRCTHVATGRHTSQHRACFAESVEIALQVIDPTDDLQRVEDAARLLHVARVAKRRGELQFVTPKLSSTETEPT